MDKYIEALGKTPDFTRIEEKHLTPAEMKKREEIAQSIEKKNPDMPMAKKMAIATATAKRVAEAVVGSKPRNEKEKKLAAMSGDKETITHGDVLKARGVTKEEAEQIDEATPGVKKPKMDPVQRARNSLADPKTKAHTLIKHIEAAKKYNFERGKGYTFDEEVEHVEEARAMDYKMSRSGVAGDRGNSKGGEITVDQKQKDEIAKIFAKPEKK